MRQTLGNASGERGIVAAKVMSTARLHHLGSDRDQRWAATFGFLGTIESVAHGLTGQWAQADRISAERGQGSYRNRYACADIAERRQVIAINVE